MSISCSQASSGPRQISTFVFLSLGSIPYSISFLPLKAKVLTLLIGLEEYLARQSSYFTLEEEIKNKPKTPSFWAGEQGEVVRKQVDMGPWGTLSTQDQAQEMK